MKTREQAEELSLVMKKIGELAEIETVCVITNMEQPIGRNVGNSLEVEEAIRALKGDMTEDVREIVLCLASQIIRLAGKNQDADERRQMILESIETGRAYEKFKELVRVQGGNADYLDNIEEASYIEEVIAKDNGYIEELDAKKIGEASMKLGAGRIKKDDEIDYTCGIVLEKKIGDYVEYGDTLAYIHSNREEVIKEAIKEVEEAYKIGEDRPEDYEHILNII